MFDSNPFYEHVGTRISSVRRSKLLSQDQLAAALGLSRASVSNIEAGRQKIALHSLVMAAKFLDTSVDSLLPEPPANNADVGGVRVSSVRPLREGERNEVLSALNRRAGRRVS